LQRMLGIGYGRAARLIDYMEEDGFVGPYNGSKSREVLLTAERWLEIQSGEESEHKVSVGTDAPSLLKVDTSRQTLMAANQAIAPAVAEPEHEEDVVESDEEEYDDEEPVDSDTVSDEDQECDEEEDEEEEYEEDGDADYYAEGDADEEYEEYEEDGEEDYEDFDEE